MNAMPQPETPQQAARRLAARAVGEGYKPAALHEYRNADGTPAYWRIRLKHPDTGEKWIRPMRSNGHGYEMGEPTFPGGKPLYRLPELLADSAATVVIVEGETCADALAKLGIVATTSGGATSADHADWSSLRNRACVIWPDNNAPGMEYAKAVIAKLQPLGCEPKLVAREIVEALPAGGDCVDWLAQHPNASGADVLALPRVAPSPLVEPCDADAPRIELVNLAEVQSAPVRWLWPGWLARGKLHVIAGAPGTGKTTIAMQWAACVSAGLPFPSQWRPAIGSVLIWSGEDDIADTLKPRLVAAGADVSRVTCIKGTANGEPFDPSRDVPALMRELAGFTDLSLIVIDPLVSAVSGDSHKNAEVRRGLAPLVDLAQRMDAALLGITHYSKGTQGREPLERVSGSLAFGALARLVFGTVKQQAEGEDIAQPYLLARVKSNIGPDGGGFAYAFEQTEAEPGIPSSRIVWGAAVEGSARDLLAEAETEADDGGQDAASFLRDLLAHGSTPVKEIFKEAEGAGYSRDQMKRAKAKLGAIAEKHGMAGGWAWRFPSSEGCGIRTEGSEGGRTKKTALFAPFGSRAAHFGGY